jgi:hypothetical protein
MRRHRIDDGGDFIDPGDRKTGQPGVLANSLFAFGNVDAESVVGSNVRLYPLHFPGKLGDCRIRSRGNILELGAA